jgi:dipeptidase E
MLLTSNGIRNDLLKSALTELVGKRFGAARVVFIPTASVAVAGDHGWLIEDLSRLHAFRWRELDILELNGLPGPMVLERLRHADVIYAEGGNHYHLANSISASGLAAELADILESKVYVGVSAGSMIFSRNLSERTGEAFGEQDDLRILGGTAARSPIGLFDWYLKPHLNSRGFPDRTQSWFERAAAQLDFPVYALDDDSAVRVRGDEVDVVSAGQWRLLNAVRPQTAGQGDPRSLRPGKRRRLPALRPSRLGRDSGALSLPSVSRGAIRPVAQITEKGPVPAVASGFCAVSVATASALPRPRPARRATDLARWAAVWCVPAMNRVPGPRLTAVCAPAKYRPGIVDSPARFTSGQPTRVTRPARISSDRNVSRVGSMRKPVPVMTWSASMLDCLGPSRLSRTPLPWGSADATLWPVRTSTMPSTRSRSHHAPDGGKVLSALRSRRDLGSLLNASGVL